MRRLIAERGWSQREFARRLEMKSSQANRLFIRDSNPTPETLERIATVFGIDRASLLLAAGTLDQGGTVRNDADRRSERIRRPEGVVIRPIYTSAPISVGAFGDTGGIVQVPARLAGDDHVIAVGVREDRPDLELPADDYALIDREITTPDDGDVCLIEQASMIDLARWPTTGRLLGVMIASGNWRARRRS
jgi:transcriptional regulator with XRE-family HTH domain